MYLVFARQFTIRKSQTVGRIGGILGGPARTPAHEPNRLKTRRRRTYLYIHRLSFGRFKTRFRTEERREPEIVLDCTVRCFCLRTFTEETERGAIGQHRLEHKRGFVVRANGPFARRRRTGTTATIALPTCATE